MTVENLLKPRYKVIAEWPESNIVTGEILLPVMIGNSWSYLVGESLYAEKYLQKYPHLFELLRWEKDRAESELPEYVLWNLSSIKEVSKVMKWKFSDAYGWICLIDYNESYFPSVSDLLPATKEQYDQFIKEHPSYKK